MVHEDEDDDVDVDHIDLEHDSSLISVDPTGQLKNQIFSTTTSMTEDSVENKQSDQPPECDV
ncbi:hypothetical protein LINGRAHAP2_LOCUS2314, partial [Linum grandiflorum]